MQERQAKQYQNNEDGDTFQHNAKHPTCNNTADSVRRMTHPKAAFIENWLDTSSWSRGVLTDNADLLQEPFDNMPANPADVFLCPADNGCSTIITSSTKSGKTTVNAYDPGFRTYLEYRNIYIEGQKPPMELTQRAKEIVTRSRSSPEIDETTAQFIMDEARRLQTKGENDIICGLVPLLIPALTRVPDPRLTCSSQHAWYDAVPVPLHPSVLAKVLPLSRPQPNAAFGYSEQAFSRNQLGTIALLVGDQSGQNYAMPSKDIRFPFLDLEFKSQAKGGTHYVATNQAANAGSVAMNGNLNLMLRSLGVETLDFDEPQFFSVSMDHEYARINVHWLRRDADEQLSFHLEALSKHFVNDADGLRAFQRAIKNILHYCANERLHGIREALDVYSQKVLVERGNGLL